MNEKNISVTAGSACVSCDNPDPCITQITVTGFDKDEHIWPVEKKIILDILDDGEGKKGYINVEGKCDEPGCPRPTLESKNEMISFKAKENKEFTLYYKKKSDQAEPQSPLDSVLPYLEQIILPSDAVDSPHTYKLITEACTGKASYVQLNVYPALEVRIAVGFSYIVEGKERSWKERRDEQKTAREKMENTKPKNGNKLRAGWTLATAQFEIANSIPLNIKYGLKIAGVEMEKKFSESTKKIRKVKSLEHINKIEKFLSNIQNNLLPDPDSKRNRKYNIFEMSIQPINIDLSYAYQRTSSYNDATHFSGFYASPFMSSELKMDLISLIATYCKVDSVAKKCRQYIEDGGDVLECYLQLTTEIHLSVGTAYTKGEWTFDAGSDNKLGFTLEGVVSLAFNTEVLFVEAALKIEGKLKTEAGFKLDQHDDGIDLVGYHDGIRAELALMADFDRSGDIDGHEIDDTSNKFSYQGGWILAAPLKESESSVRVNLFGKQRVIPERQVTPASPWAMGSNPVNSSPHNNSETQKSWAMGFNPIHKS